MSNKDILLLFINICNNTTPTLKKNFSLDEIYLKIGLESEKYLSKDRIEKYIESKLNQIVQDNSEEDIKTLHKVKSGIVLKGIIEGDRKHYHYLDIILTLIGILGHNVKYIPNFFNPIWIEIIELVKNYLVLSNVFCQAKREIHKKEIDIAKTIIKLNSIGCGIHISNCEILFENEEIVLKKIEQGIKKIGGKKFLTILFTEILYVKEFERFLILRQANPPIHSKIEIELPHGYLFNLAIKNIDIKGKKINLQNEIKSIKDLSKMFCLVKYPVQNYSIWEDILHKSKSPLQYFNDLIIRGTLFDIPQFQAKYAIEICNYILEKENKQYNNLLQYNLSELKKVIIYLINLSQETSIKTFFTIKLVNDLKIDLSTIQKILGDLTQNCKDVNVDYITPTDYNKITFWQKPLLRARDGEYILLPKSIIAFSFYEALIGIIRGSDKNIDIRVGSHFENFIKAKMHEKGISYSSGKYAEKLGDKKEVGEADIIVETTSSIVLFECKKKPLTRNAKSGSNFSILTDLAGSILESQLQCSRTDAILRINKKITLKDGIQKKEVCLNNRTVERFTFTLADYGVVQDRIILGEILQELIKHKFSLKNNNDIDVLEFSEMEKKIAKITKKQDDLISFLNIIGDDKLFFNSGFLSLNQFMFLLSKSTNNDVFYKQITSLKHISMGSFDFYQEYFMRKLSYNYFKSK